MISSAPRYGAAKFPGGKFQRGVNVNFFGDAPTEKGLRAHRWNGKVGEAEGCKHREAMHRRNNHEKRYRCWQQPALRLL